MVVVFKGFLVVSFVLFCFFVVSFDSEEFFLVVSTLFVVSGFLLTPMGFFVTAFVTGALACKFMLEIVKRGKLIWFAAYCALAGAVAIVSYLM